MIDLKFYFLFIEHVHFLSCVIFSEILDTLFYKINIKFKASGLVCHTEVTLFVLYFYNIVCSSIL